jgi:radical SAM protein with 4Fe4S-binding SPASM domain
VTHADSLSLPVSFTTNGTRLDADTARRLVESGAGEISVSIDGPQPIHDALRGPGTFAQAAAGLRHLLQARRAARTEARGFRGPSITVNVTVSPLVAGHLAETIRAVRETLAADGPAALPGALEPAASVHAPSRKGAAAGMVDSFRIHHLWFVSGAELQAHQAAVQEALGVHAPGAAAHVLRAGPGLDPEALAREIGRLRRLRGVTSFPHLRGKQIPDFYSEGPSSTRRRCGAPFHAVVIKPNGDVRYCPDEWIDDYVLGNIREHALETIWNGSAARRFRAVLLQKGSFPGCRRCGWMYSF